MADENDIVKDESADQVAENAQDALAGAGEAPAVEETAQKADSDSQQAAEEQAATDSEPAKKPELSAPAAAEAPSEKKKATGIGDLFGVGVLSLILGVVLVLPAALGLLPSGSSSAAEGGTAATVNGTAISEAEVTDYIMKFREQQGLTSDDAWGEWMVQSGYTAETIRSVTIDFYVERELQRQAIDTYGVTVDESEVDNYISSITEQVGGEEAFQQALESAGIDIETYRDESRFSLQQQALAQKVAGDDLKVEDEQILEIAKAYYPDSVDEKAKSLKDIDDETVEQVRSMLESSALQEAFAAWMEEYRANAQIEVSPMPEGLPYAIDLTPYEQAAAQEAEQADGAEEPFGADEAEDEGESDADAIEVEAEDDDAEIEVVEVEDDAEDSGSSEAADK